MSDWVFGNITPTAGELLLNLINNILLDLQMRNSVTFRTIQHFLNATKEWR